jgi:hypothetical protein
MQRVVQSHLSSKTQRDIGYTKELKMATINEDKTREERGEERKN